MDDLSVLHGYLSGEEWVKIHKSLKKMDSPGVSYLWVSIGVNSYLVVIFLQSKSWHIVGPWGPAMGYLSKCDNVFWFLWFIQPKSDSVRPDDAIWWHRSGSTSAQAMAWCLVAPSHYLDQCWLVIIETLWLSPDDIFTKNSHDINH